MNIFFQYGDREVSELWNCIIRLIPRLFNGVDVKPSLLHGDLWRGNSGQTKTEEPGKMYFYVTEK